MSPLIIAIVILAVGAILTLVLLLASNNSKQKLSSSIPPAMRPGYSDDQLEGNHLERMMTWGLVLTIFFSLFLPLYWWREPIRAQDKQEGLFARDFSAGEGLYQANCAECHGADAAGGAAPSPYGGDPWPAPNLVNIAARYADSRIVVDVREHIEETLYRGRPGSPMPTWGAAYGGPMTDFQIEAITDWILANQVGDVAEASGAINDDGEVVSGEELYLANCAKCHGAELQGIVGPSLQNVFERHSEESVLGILQNGIGLVGSGMSMPPWQEAYVYPDARYDDEALGRIIDYLQDNQSEDVPDDANLYQTPNVGEAVEADDQTLDEALGRETDDAEADTESADGDPDDEATDV